MSVYIPGMEMPVIVGNRGIKAEIRQIDGKLEFGIMTGGYSCCEQWTYYPIVPVPPHGRLGDLDEIVRYKERLVVDADKINPKIRYVVDTKYIDTAPTIIPADTGG